MDSCPSISSAGNESEILIPSGTKKFIKVNARIIGAYFIVQTRFVCQFNIEGRLISLNAQLLGDTMYCDAMTFEYTSHSPNLTVPMAVLWGGSMPLDNPDNIHGNFYNHISFISTELFLLVLKTFSDGLPMSLHG